VGRLAGETRLEGVTLVLGRTAAQEEQLQALIVAQHDPASPLYHHWLTPEALGARFGVADADVGQVSAWLERHGLQVDSVSRARDGLRFSGTAAQLEAAFGTELHLYQTVSGSRFAPWADATVPAALAPLVRAVTGMSSFRPRSHLRLGSQFTSSLTGSHFLTPADVEVVYHVTPAHQAGLDGTGVAIAVVGQSAISPPDIEAFQSASGLAVKDPQLVLVPGSGSAVVRTGDETESDLDLEWSGALAPGATIRFVYVGDAANQSVWDALQYAVDQDLAPIVSISYGACEPALSAGEYAAVEATLAKAAAQGQSVVASSGDSGSLDCAGVSGLLPSTQQALAVDFPSSSEYVTGVGGTEFPSADVGASATQYWTAATAVTGDVLASALSYIPEQVWNDGTGAAGGGGVSVLTTRPSWQAGVLGLSSGTNRLVPDLSLDASPANAPYLFCSSDAKTGVTGSCSHGFRAADGSHLTAAGGTSFGAPVFAGMLALVEQKLGASGLGVVAPTLYRLASDSTTYASAFHDVTLGGNGCAPGSGCPPAGGSSYAAGTGYDMASGLGSVDLFSLLATWPASSPGFTVEASDVALAAGGSGAAPLTILPVDGYSGTITWTVSSTPALGQGCLAASSTVVAPGSVAKASVTIRAEASACRASSASAVVRGAGRGATSGGGRLPESAALAALAVMLGLLVPRQATRRPRRRGWGLAAVLLAALGLGLPACGGGGSSSGPASKGSYEVQVVGADSASASVTATTTFTLTVD
jgi:subtilase family serine protease